MNWVVHQTNFLSPSHLPIPLFPPPPPPPPPIFSSSSSSSLETNLENKISPSMLLIIVILAVIFFISGLLHLLVRFLLKPTIEKPEDPDNLTAFQGQLQQLFHLHDSGVDQSFIDTLPVFHYKAIIGIKDPFDCAVCLCEFEPDDKLRLLPKCSHAFHIECIDTWLLSHSTCPLCRSSLLPEFSPNNSCSPVVLVLESGTGSERSFREAASCSSQRGEFLVDSNPHVGILHDGDGDDNDEFGSNLTSNENSLKTGEVGGGKEDLTSSSYSSVLDGIPETRVVQVKLGKFRNAEVSESSTSNNSKLDQRRCFSMGSYEYVMNEASLLQVAIKPTKKKPRRSTKKMGSRLAMSECDFHSVREGFKGFVDSSKSSEPSARLSNTSKKESFSISKIWLRQKREKPVMSVDNSRRAFSFRLPVNDESMAKASSVGQQIESMAKVYSVSQRIGSGFEVGSEVDLDIEVGSCNNSIVSMGSQIGEAPSFARRTLMWIVGRQNKVGSHL